MATALSLLGIVATWILLAIALGSLGAVFLNGIVPMRPTYRNAWLSIWMGLPLLTLSLLVWHFVLPVDQRALLSVLGASSIALLLQRRWWHDVLSQRPAVADVLGVSLFAIWAADHALSAGGMDDLLYEFQAVRWFHDYAVVPGLANLHGRIGFNNAHHLICAMLSVGPLAGRVNHIFNGFFLTLLAARAVSCIRSYWHGDITASTRFSLLFVSLLLGGVLFGVFGTNVATLKVDLCVSVLIALLASLYLDLFDATHSGEHPHTAALLITLSMTAVAMKLSAIFFGAVLTGFVLAWLWRQHYRFSRHERWLVGAACLTSTVMLVAFIARGVLLSGLPLYPSLVGATNVDWRVPTAQASAEMAMVTGWARLHPTYSLSDLAGWGWFVPWASSSLLTDKYTIVLPLFLAIVIAPCLFGLNPAVRRLARPHVALLAASAVALVMWFRVAPSGRFGSVYFWIVFASVLTVSSSVPRAHQRLPYRLSLGLVAVVVCVAALSSVGVGLTLRAPELSALIVSLGASVVLVYTTLRTAVSQTRLACVAVLCIGCLQFIDRAAADMLHRRWNDLASLVMISDVASSTRATLRCSPGTWRSTRSGLLILHSVESCWDTPLPNTRYFNPCLRLRRADNMGSGFASDVAPDVGRYGYSSRIQFLEGKDIDLVTPDSMCGSAH